MPAPILEVERILLKPPVFHVETQNYNEKTSEIWSDWRRRLGQSTFLSVKYGLNDAEAMLDRVGTVQYNWDSYGSEPPSIDAIQAARQMLAVLAEAMVLPTTIVPSAEGGVSIYFMTGGDRTVYIETYNNGSQALVMYDQDGNTEVSEIGREVAESDVASRILDYLG